MNKITIFLQKKSIMVCPEEDIELTIESPDGGKITEVVKANGIIAYGVDEKSFLEEIES